MSRAQLVLASGSPRRRALLRGLGLEPAVRPVDVDETPRAGEPAAEYVRRLAETKADAADADPGEVLLAADTTVALDGEILGKPDGEADARRMLERLSGREHQVLTGVAVLAAERGFRRCEVERTRVRFAPLSAAEIAWYAKSGEPFDKAGGYAIQGLGALFVERIEGNYSNVVGLPLPLAYRLLQAAGFSLLSPRT